MSATYPAHIAIYDPKLARRLQAAENCCLANKTQALSAIRDGIPFQIASAEKDLAKATERLLAVRREVTQLFQLVGSGKKKMLKEYTE